MFSNSTFSRSLLTAHRSLLTAHRSLLTAHRSLLTAHCSPLTAHRLLLTAWSWTVFRIGLLTQLSCLHRIHYPKIEPFEEGVSEVKTTIRVNRKRPESMTKQITDQLTGLIESGAMTVGSYLPSERELANSLKVARNVVRGSYENLMKAGKIQSEGRKGRSVRAAGGKRRAATTKSSKTGAKARKK